MAVFDHLAALGERFREVLPHSELKRRAPFDDERIRRLGPQGIFKPRQFTLPLSIATAPPVPGKEPSTPTAPRATACATPTEGTTRSIPTTSGCAGRCRRRRRWSTSSASCAGGTSPRGRCTSWPTTRRPSHSRSTFEPAALRAERLLDSVAEDSRCRPDILAEIDGPMLRHGLQGLEGGRLVVPRQQAWRPGTDYLTQRYERFRAAG